MASNTDVSAVTTVGLVSIVVPCCGMLEYTKLCVPSILKHSRPPYELVFLDVGSLDGTAEYLAGLQAGLAGKLHIDVVRAQTDLGLKDACQQAFRQTLGEYIVFLNNDCVVTHGWLNQLLGLVSLSVSMGSVGPMSNLAAPPQLVETVSYRAFASTGKSVSNPVGGMLDVAAMERFAESHRAEMRGKWMKTDRLGGFCLLTKREVLDKVGPTLNESELGPFDTDIFSVKTQEAGYSLAVCKDLFVHHFGTRAFAHGPKSTG